MNESCVTCRRNYRLEKWDYSDVQHKGVQETEMEGYVCMAFADEGLAVLMIGENPEFGMCECYEPKKQKNIRVVM